MEVSFPPTEKSSQLIEFRLLAHLSAQTPQAFQPISEWVIWHTRISLSIPQTLLIRASGPRQLLIAAALGGLSPVLLKCLQGNPQMNIPLWHLKMNLCSLGP